MHETIFSEEIIRVINEKKRSLDVNSKISCVNVRLSPLSHVRPKTLESTFLQMVKESNTEGVSLNIKSSKVELECKSCGRKFLVEEPVFICPHCDNKDFNIKEAKEFFIESVEVEKR